MPWVTLVLLGFHVVDAAGGVVSPQDSTTPSLIRLVGMTGGVPDAATGRFTVVARDRAHNPIPGYPIVIDFSNCPDVVICSDQMDPDALTNCSAKTVRKFANVLGEATFTILGGSTGPGHAATLAGGGLVFGAGVLLGRPSVATYDLDGVGGVGAGDLSTWLSDFGSGEAWARSDFDGSGTISAADLSAWLRVYGAGTSSESCRASCP